MIKKCLFCGKEFEAKTGNQKYCSASCRSKNGYINSNKNSSVTKKCEICGKEFTVSIWRSDKAKYCSKECQHQSLHGSDNCVCTNCGKSFHLKEYRINKYSRNMGFFCCKECADTYRKTWFKGENNHQYGLKGELNSSFKGDKISQKNLKLQDVWVYSPEYWSNHNGRVLEHHLNILKYRNKFPECFFQNIDGKWAINKMCQVHHIDCNHNNNDPINLIPLTRGGHTYIHNSLNRIGFDSIQKIIGVLKGGELLENPEVDNQQPSIDSNIFKGSETNIRVRLVDNTKDSNDNTSALLNQIINVVNDYIVQAQDITRNGYEMSKKKLESQE